MWSGAESLNGNENCWLYWNLSEHVRAFYYPACYGDPSLFGSLGAFIELPENLRGRDSSAPRGNNPARAHQQPMNRKCAFTQITRFLTPEGNIVSCLFCTAVTELCGVLVWISFPCCFFFVFFFSLPPLADVGWVLSFVFIFSLFIVAHHSAPHGRKDGLKSSACTERGWQLFLNLAN